MKTMDEMLAPFKGKELDESSIDEFVRLAFDHKPENTKSFMEFIIRSLRGDVEVSDDRPKGILKSFDKRARELIGKFYVLHKLLEINRETQPKEVDKCYDLVRDIFWKSVAIGKMSALDYTDLESIKDQVKAEGAAQNTKAIKKIFVKTGSEGGQKSGETRAAKRKKLWEDDATKFAKEFRAKSPTLTCPKIASEVLFKLEPKTAPSYETILAHIRQLKKSGVI